MADKISNRIDALEQRLRELKAQQQRIEGRKRATKARRDRREDLRRKILVGAIVLEKVDRGEIEKGVLLEWMKGALSREEDRALFGLSTAGTESS
jgi:large subunit ribosomal protein L7/L12